MATFGNGTTTVGTTSTSLYDQTSTWYSTNTIDCYSTPVRYVAKPLLSRRALARVHLVLMRGVSDTPTVEFASPREFVSVAHRGRASPRRLRRGFNRNRWRNPLALA